jgi:hypothetical protein
VVLALGKDRKAYLLDANALGGIGGQLAESIGSEIRIITAPAVYPVDSDVFVALAANCPNASRNHDVTVLRITGGSTPSMTTAWCGAIAGRGSPIVRPLPIAWLFSEILGARWRRSFRRCRRGRRVVALRAEYPYDGIRVAIRRCCLSIDLSALFVQEQLASYSRTEKARA